MFSNSSGSVSRPRTDERICLTWPSTAGGWPIWPSATCTFCSRMALTTSVTVRLRDASLSGSSQIRML